MSIMKKLFVIFACAVIGVRADEWTDPNTDYTWTYQLYDDDTVEIQGPSSPLVGVVSIPAMVNGKPVARIGDWAFGSCRGMTGVIIPDGVKRIGAEAFANSGYTYEGLRMVQIPNSVVEIGAGAFRSCPLESVNIPGRVTSIENGTFRECSELKSVTIPHSVTRIGDYVFDSCSSLRSIAIPNSVMNIGEYAFRGCQNLKSVTIPGSVVTIGACAFSGCGIENVVISDGVVRIGDYAFGSCSSLTKLVLPNSVTILGRGTFSDCSGLTSVIMLNSCVAQSEYGYWYGNGPYEYGSPFSGCSSIENVTVPRAIEGFPLNYLFPDSGGITNVVVLDGTTRIRDEAFSGCGSLQSVKLPPSVMQVGNRAFSGCSSLTSVVFEGSAPEVGENIYSGTSTSLVTYVNSGSIGWAGGISAELPQTWNDRAIAFIGASAGINGNEGGNSSSNTFVSLCTTNIVVHYVLNSVVPEFATPVSTDVGFVTVITEIKGGAIAIPESWAANYPRFTEMFGADFSSALTKPTGKRDSQGNALLVWHDYVAGTDPTKEDDVFKASITMVDGSPVISYTPELPESEKSKRKYTIYGKTRLQDDEWQIVDDNASIYNFFKVTVEMK